MTEITQVYAPPYASDDSIEIANAINYLLEDQCLGCSAEALAIVLAAACVHLAKDDPTKTYEDYVLQSVINVINACNAARSAALQDQKKTTQAPRHNHGDLS